MLRNFRKIYKYSTRHLHSEKIGIIGVPFDKGQPKEGVTKAPDLLRRAGLVKVLQNIDNNIDIRDYGDVSYENCDNVGQIPNMKQYEHAVSCTREVSKQVANVIKDERVCLTIGGDHSISIGTIDGHVKAKSNNVAVLWIDAHADLNTNKTSSTGNIHGMPLAILVRELSDYWPYLPGMDWQQPVMSVKNLAYIGLRSVDSYEKLVIDKLAITAFGMEDIEKYGISTVLDMALQRIDPSNSRSLHVSFDIDCLDPLEAPSTGVPVRGGLTLREGIYIMEEIEKTGRLGALDVVEINPDIGTKNEVDRTVDAAVHVIQAAFGFKRMGLKPLHSNTLPLQTFPPKEGII